MFSVARRLLQELSSLEDEVSLLNEMYPHTSSQEHEQYLWLKMRDELCQTFSISPDEADTLLTRWAHKFTLSKRV